MPINDGLLTTSLRPETWEPGRPGEELAGLRQLLQGLPQPVPQVLGASEPVGAVEAVMVELRSLRLYPLSWHACSHLSQHPQHDMPQTWILAAACIAHTLPHHILILPHTQTSLYVDKVYDRDPLPGPWGRGPVTLLGACAGWTCKYVGHAGMQQPRVVGETPTGLAKIALVRSQHSPNPTLLML